MFKVFVVICLIVCPLLLCVEAAKCDATASLRSRDPFVDSQGRNNTLYDVRVTNVGACALSGVTISISLPFGAAVTGLASLEFVIGGPLGGSPAFSLINFGGVIAPGASFNGATFTLALPANTPPTVSIVSVHGRCGSCAPDAAPAGGFAGMKQLNETFQLMLKTAATQARRFKLLEDNDFVFDFSSATVEVTKGQGGRTIAATPNNFPAIIGANIAMTVGFIAPCGINLPHTHPRATEINFIVSGSFQSGLFMENGVRFIGHNITAGMATVFPQGAIHFEQNMNCETAVFVAAFNNEDPGVQTTASSFFGLPAEIVTASLNLPESHSVAELMSLLPHNPALGVAECKKRCGLL